MGLFKNIVSKISGLFLKSEKALKMADLKQATRSIAKTVDGPQVRTGRPNFAHKSGFYEGIAVEHFAKHFANKTLQDVVDFAGDLRNFANPSEYETKIKTMNAQRRQAFANATMLTVDGLFQYFAGGQNLSEQDRIAYSRIAKQTQAKARALAYIKANFVGICNMKEIYDEEGDKAFSELMEIVNSYADADINGYTMPEFNPEVVNDEVFNSNVYVKGAAYAQRRCDDILAERVDAESIIAQENYKASANVNKNVEEYDANIDEIASRNAKIQDIDEKLAQADIVSEKLAELKEEYDENEDEHAILRNWFKGKRDIVKPAAERRDEFMNALLNIARDFPVAYFDGEEVDGKMNGFSFIIDKDTLSSDLEEDRDKEFEIIFDQSINNPYDAFVDAIDRYNGDDTIEHTDDIFRTKIEVESDGTRNSYLYTTRQEKVMEQIFEIMKQHAQNIVNDSEYQAGDNLLENFKYKTVKHTPAPEQLKEVGEAIFGMDIEQGQTIDVDFDDLSVDQLKILCMFIRSNEAVRAFIGSNKDIRAFEIDSLLLGALDPKVANKRDLKLGAVMNAMQREAIDSSIKYVEEQTEELETNKEKNITARDEHYAKADKNLENLRQIRSDLEEERETPSDSAAAVENDTIRNQITTGIDMILASETLPENASGIDENTQKIGEVEIKNSGKVTTYADEISDIATKAAQISDDIEADQVNITNPSNSIKAKAKFYERYFTSADSEKVLEYITNIETIITKIKETEKANSVEEHEAE